MKPFHHYIIASTLLAASGLIAPDTSHAVVKPTIEDGPALPEIWVKAGPRERLKATRAAEVDADRLLAERIYGLQVDSESTVHDLVAGDDSIAGAVAASMIGVYTVGDPEYLDDGRVQVVRAVKWREVLECLNRVIKTKKLGDGSTSTISDVSKTDRKTNEKIIEVMGNSAVPGSLGHQRILAKRAAEMDAYRRLAGRMMGFQIEGTTTVRDFAVENDEILTSLSQVLKAATPTAIKYDKNDGGCEVTMEITTQDLVRTVKRFAKGNTAKTLIKDEIQERTISETGRGAMRDATEEDAPSSPEESFEETEMILRQVVESGPVVQ